MRAAKRSGRPRTYRTSAGTARTGATIERTGANRGSKYSSARREPGPSLEQPIATRGIARDITPRYVQRLFEEAGATLTEYVLGQRLARAHRLLTDPRRTERTLTAIAFEVGFSDLSYFNRAFRRRFGATPSDARATPTQ